MSANHPLQRIPGFRQGDWRKLGIPIKNRMDHKPVGPVTVTIDYAVAGDNRYTLVGKDRTTMHMVGNPIEELRKKFGGNTGLVDNPFGGKTEIKLDSRVPNGKNIYVVVKFHFVDANKVGKKGPFVDDAPL
jgi:hypothetical protein